MSKVYVLAASMTRFAKYPGRSVASLGREAIKTVLIDAGVRPDEVEAVYAGRSFGGAIDGQVSVPGQVALRDTGIEDVPVFNLDNACAAAASAFHLAMQALRAEQYEIVLVVGMDKLYAIDRKQSMLALFGAMDVEEMSWIGEAIHSGPEASSVFMENYYAKVAKQYMNETGATPQDYARVAVKNRQHAAGNPYAQYQTLLTEEQVMSSAMIADPLRSLMCSPLTDGASALLLCSANALKRFSGVPIEVIASVVRSGRPNGTSADPLVSRAARQAFDQGSVGPEELDLLEVHDASSVAELIAIEEICLLKRGNGLKLLRDGATSIHGSMPVNVSGGLLSRGHPGAATGAGQITELVWQLQGRSKGRQLAKPRIALAHSLGGAVGNEPATTAITILRHP